MNRKDDVYVEKKKFIMFIIIKYYNDINFLNF